MKKKILALLLVGVLSASVTACGGSSDSSDTSDSGEATESTDPSETEEEESEIPTGKVDTISLDNSEGTLTYTGHEVTTDYDGNPAILIYFDYTNKKDESSYAQLTFYPQVFQNGVECEMGFSVAENEALSNASKEIMKDTTLNVAYIYTLQDSTNPVTLKVSDQSADNIMKDISQEQELALQ